MTCVWQKNMMSSRSKSQTWPLMQYLTLLAISFLSTSLFAIAWDIESSEIDADELQLLQDRFPNIEKQRDISDLIHEIARMSESQQIQAFHDEKQNKIIFRGLEASVIKDIELRLVIRTFKGDLQKLTEKYFNQPDSPTLRYKLIQEVESFLTGKGFPTAKITMRTDPLKNNHVRVILEVDENQPCLIKDIIFDPPDQITTQLSLEVNDLCDLSIIKNTQLELENLYEASGYFQSEVSPPNVIYNPDKSRATIEYKINRGHKIQYEILIGDDEFNLRKFFADDIISKEDANSIDPNAMIAEITKRYQNRGFSDVQVERP